MTQVAALTSDDPRVGQVMELVRKSFAYMEGRIDPPSSLNRMTLDDFKRKCDEGWVLAIGDPVVACAVLTTLPHAMYIGKFAVDARCRGTGLASTIMVEVEEIAIKAGYAHLELQTRIELVENQRIFQKMGFEITDYGSHSGYNRVTEVTMQKMIPAGQG